ncbi:SGNH/GDSL hydrolase family protein [Daejeonella sp.]|jgi:lysophospholipase L1-like esterase|uniref:SGNH/GDSL hydrolase family protein n=1 Tax=Daejeonella sp. TaxID=2805397 RepID=UPI0037BE42FB
MKKIILSISILILLTSMQIQKSPKVIFFGDSITEAGVKPGGYIFIMQDKIKQGTAPNYELIGSGIGGNKVYDLYLRLQEDVLDKKPDVVVIYIGVNDVWHKQSSQTGTDPDKFVAFYSAIIKKLQSSGIKVIICTPAVIGERTDFTNQLDGDLNRYSEMIRKLAISYGCGLIDIRKSFLDYNLANNPQNKESGILTSDRVHLNQAGNQMLAELMFKGLSK